MKTIVALLIKQCKDSFRNLPSLMILIIYPAVALIMISAMQGEENTADFFVPMFAAMHCSFAPLVLSSNILSEENEKGTLRSLLLAGVSRIKYLISLSLFVFFAVMATGAAFLLMKSFETPSSAVAFAVALMTGSVISILLGLCIGISSKNVTAANGMAVPVGLVFALIPMLGKFNHSIADISSYTYSGQLRTVLEGGEFTEKALLVSSVYFVTLLLGLLLLFRTVMRRQ